MQFSRAFRPRAGKNQPLPRMTLITLIYTDPKRSNGHARLSRGRAEIGVVLSNIFRSVLSVLISGELLFFRSRAMSAIAAITAIRRASRAPQCGVDRLVFFRSPDFPITGSPDFAALCLRPSARPPPPIDTFIENKGQTSLRPNGDRPVESLFSRFSAVESGPISAFFSVFTVRSAEGRKPMQLTWSLVPAFAGSQQLGASRLNCQRSSPGHTST